MKKQKENSYENITWSEMGKQNEQAKKVHLPLNYLDLTIYDSSMAAPLN